VKPVLAKLIDTIFRFVPSGLGSKGKIRLSANDLDQVANRGVDWAIEHGYGWQEDAEFCEENGQMKGADAAKVSPTAKSRGAPQLGSLGSGNHFLEVQRVDRIFDENAAKVMGIEEVGQVTVMVHSGSRGYGHQVCSDYLHVMERAVHKYNISLPDRELACAPSGSPESRDYVAAMAAAANYAWSNRQMMSHQVRQAFEEVFRQPADKLDMHLIYDVAHNIAKLEEHKVDGGTKKVWVHRKGATRSFPPGHPAVPSVHRGIGQVVIIPGSMEDCSYLMVGTEKSMELSFGSTAHGAGRMMSRSAAIRQFRGSEIKNRMERTGVLVRSPSLEVLAEEAGPAYKPVDRVAEVSEKVGIARRVARLVPLAVTKG